MIKRKMSDKELTAWLKNTVRVIVNLIFGEMELRRSVMCSKCGGRAEFKYYEIENHQEVAKYYYRYSCPDCGKETTRVY